MKWLKRIFIVIGILILVGVGSSVLYGAAYSEGETAGYEDGYISGKQDGYTEGETAGYDKGYSAGYSLGEQKGYDKGYPAGYNLGEQEGYDEGYISGEQDGYTEGYNLGETNGYSSGNQDGLEEGYISGKADGYEVGVEAGLGHGYTLRDPTYEEAVTFLRQDKTDENEYILDTYGVYVCSHFARDVCNNAEAEGLRCAFVELRYSDVGHSIIAFNTIDKGLVYFEPQSDEKAKPIVGKHYYQCIETEPGYYYEEPPYDDTIMDILVVW